MLFFQLESLDGDRASFLRRNTGLWRLSKNRADSIWCSSWLVVFFHRIQQRKALCAFTCTTSCDIKSPNFSELCLINMQYMINVNLLALQLTAADAVLPYWNAVFLLHLDFRWRQVLHRGINLAMKAFGNELTPNLPVQYRVTLSGNKLP